MYVDVTEEAKEEKKEGKYITIAIETEENDIEIGIMRAENDIKDEEIEVHMAELSPRGFPITTGETRNIYRKEIRKVATWNGGIMGPVEYSYSNPKEWTLENIPGRKQLDQITVKDITLWH